jgi:serine/threonine protein kinase
VVLAAEHVRLRQSIAIKFLNPQMLGIPEIVERFEREARAAATLRSRHVVRVTDVEQTSEGVPYMVMELLEGADLESEREWRRTLPYSEVVDYVLQACGALSEAHDAGIVHRDLKPGNLFLARDEAGDRPILKVLDFGISKFLNGEDAKLTSAGAIMGTALYMSPEQIRGDASINVRSDIWALGVILYELISGEAPWVGPPTRVAAGIVSDPAPDLMTKCGGIIPEPLARTIHAMLAKNPADRPQTVSDVAFALAPFAPPGSVGADIVDVLARRSQRNFGAVSASAPISRPSLGAPISSPAISAPVPSSNPAGPVSSDRFQLVVSTRANPERSTMAATTSSTEAAGRPRALWKIAAGACALAVAGLAVIVFVTRSKGPTTTAGAAPDPPASALVVTATPKTSEPLASSSAVPNLPAVGSATPAVSVALPAKKPPAAPSTSVAVHHPTPPTTAASPPKPPKPPEPPSPASNPLFLK